MYITDIQYKGVSYIGFSISSNEYGQHSVTLVSDNYRTNEMQLNRGSLEKFHINGRDYIISDFIDWLEHNKNKIYNMCSYTCSYTSFRRMETTLYIALKPRKIDLEFRKNLEIKHLQYVPPFNNYVNIGDMCDTMVVLNNCCMSLVDYMQGSNDYICVLNSLEPFVMVKVLDRGKFEDFKFKNQKLKLKNFFISDGRQNYHGFGGIIR